MLSICDVFIAVINCHPVKIAWSKIENREISNRGTGKILIMYWKRCTICLDVDEWASMLHNAHRYDQGTIQGSV